jgi:CheY-like chemotaxis protein
MQPEEIKILLVEDDDVDTEVVIRAFKKNSIPNMIVTASDGIEALEILRATGDDRVRKPYIILLDLNMPRMNGFEFLDEIRNDPKLRDSIIFVLTTSEAEKDRTRSYKKNIAGYLSKANVGPSFKNALELLESYWSTVMLPVDSEAQ